MKVVAIIAEYNPFHLGHFYQIQQIRKDLEADYIIILMSGNFVQRGLPALFDKYTRAHMALAAGADLILELPAYYALGSAEYFARGAVSILDALHVVDTLHFGSECGDINQLQSLASILASEPPLYKAALQEALKTGISYPNARKKACAAYLQSEGTVSAGIEHLLTILDSPNNILGLEYCMALTACQSQIKPFTITRNGAGYQDEILSTEQFPSALSLRLAFQKDADYAVFKPFIPDAAYDILLQHAPIAIQENDFSQILHYKLLVEENLQNYLDISSDLADRIQKNTPQFTSITAFCDLLKSKNYTYTRISRVLFHILLNMQTSFLKELSCQNYGQYARMLGFRTSATPLLSAIKKQSSIPLLSKLADAEPLLTDIGNKLLQNDLFAADIYQLVSTAKTGLPAKSEFQQRIIRV